MTNENPNPPDLYNGAPPPKKDPDQSWIEVLMETDSGKKQPRAFRLTRIEYIEPLDDKRTIITMQGLRYGPQGFEKTYYPEVLVYLPYDKLVEKLYSGGSPIDLKQYCEPPKAYPNEPDIGTLMKDGTRYAGISPTTKQPMFVAPADEKRRLSFGSAKRRAKKRSEETGKAYRVPTESELRKIFKNRAKFGGFDTTPYYPASWYWSSTAPTALTARSIRFSDGGTGQGSEGGKTRKYNVRLIRD